MRYAVRPLVLAIALALVVVACSAPGSGTSVSETPGSSEVPSSPSETDPGVSSTEPPSEGGNQSSTSSTDAPKPPPDGPSAPDFTMALESGGTFTLSDAAKPVYMVFWAEW